MTSSKARQDSGVLVLASSREVEQGWYAERIVKSDLEGMAEQINGPRAMLNHIEHDPATMPLLKITEARVVPDPDDDEFLLIARDCIADDISEERSPHSDEGMVRLRWTQDDRPFINRSISERNTNEIEIVVNPANFDNLHRFQRFKTELESEHQDVRVGEAGRRSAMPEPLCEIVVPTVIAAPVVIWLWNRAKKVVTETVDNVLRETVTEPLAEWLTKKVKSVFVKYREAKTDDTRLITVVIRFAYDADKELALIVKLCPEQEFTLSDPEQLRESIRDLGELMDLAEGAVFACRNGEWSLCYLTLKDGSVIGSLTCFNETMGKLNYIKRFNEQLTCLAQARGISVEQAMNMVDTIVCEQGGQDDLLAIVHNLLHHTDQQDEDSIQP